MTKKIKGFTLIELLVVIAIIGLLATLSVVALNAARVKSRDAKRLSDVRQIQTALEMYYMDFTHYPTGTIGNNTILSANGFSSTASGTVYLGSVPTNPIPASDGVCNSASVYTYTQTAAGSSYSLSYCHSVNGPATATPADYK